MIDLICVIHVNWSMYRRCFLMIDVLVHDKAFFSQLYANLCYYVTTSWMQRMLLLCLRYATFASRPWHSLVPRVVYPSCCTWHLRWLTPVARRQRFYAIILQGGYNCPARARHLSTAWSSYLCDRLAPTWKAFNVGWLRLFGSSLIRLLRFHLLRQTGIG